MDDDYERTLLVKNECFVYRLPPRPSNRGYRAADWGLDKPQWTGRMKIVVTGKKLCIKFDDRSGELFAKAPVDTYPGVAVEPVTDSSRYFVIRIMDDNGRTAFIGAGFADRGDAFDFNVALQDHFKQVKTDETIKNEPLTSSKLDLGLKEGQTFTIKLGNSSTKPKPKPKVQAGGGAGLLLPPPPGPASVAAKADAEWGDFSSSAPSSASSGWVTF